MHWVAIWQWLVANGLFRDVLATSIGLAAAKLMTVRLVREHKKSQAEIADLLDTRTPGGLSDVVRAVRRRARGEEPEDPTPDSDDGDDELDDGEDIIHRRIRTHGGAVPDHDRPAADRPAADRPAADRPAADPASLIHFRPFHDR